MVSELSAWLQYSSSGGYGWADREHRVVWSGLRIISKTKGVGIAQMSVMGSTEVSVYC